MITFKEFKRYLKHLFSTQRALKLFKTHIAKRRVYMRGIIAIDDGGYSTAVKTKDVIKIFPSVKGLSGQRNLTELAHEFDFIVEYKGEKYVAGMLAKYDCSYPLQMHTESKQNLFYDLSVLISIHQFGYSKNYVILSVPISMHNDTEKNGRAQRLRGAHTITVNGVTKTFMIEEVKVAPESAVAYWVNEPGGKNRFIDLGSRTIGYATTVNNGEFTRFIDSESGVLKGKGIEALSDSYDQKALADYIGGRLLSVWNDRDNVYLIGGGALDRILVKHIKEYFNNVSEVNRPDIANVLGMYKLGCLAYEL